MISQALQGLIERDNIHSDVVIQQLGVWKQLFRQGSIHATLLPFLTSY